MSADNRAYVKLAIADPPYLGRAEMLYGERRTKTMNEGGRLEGGRLRKADVHPDAARWDDPATHEDLVRRLVQQYDGWAVAMLPEHLYDYLSWVPRQTRIAVWHDPQKMPTGSHPRRRFEIVLVYVPARRRRVVDIPGPHVSDILTAPHQTGTGRRSTTFVGAKPSAWTRWVLDMLGYDPATDKVDDLFPGSGSVQAVINTPRLPMVR